MNGSRTGQRRPVVLIAGGGIAGLEALIALRKLADPSLRIVLAAPEPDFSYRPLLVEEPFTLQPPEQHSLPAITEELDAEFALAGLEAVDAAAHRARLSDGSRVEYDAALICVGARPRPAFTRGVTFTDREGPGSLRRLLHAIEGGRADRTRRLVFVVPAGVSWPLPVYELALMTERDARALGVDVEIEIVTPEAAPLIMFGEPASEAVGSVLAGRGIGVRAGSRVREERSGELVLAPAGELLRYDGLAAMPLIEGPRIEGVPADEDGFIPIDEHARVEGAEDLYAAGDCSNFPIKQGGLGTQQADAAAAHVAARFGAELEPYGFHPVLRGKLFVGEESLYLSHDLTGGTGEGESSFDYLWWPPHKVGGRYLAPWLARESLDFEAEPPVRPLEVEIALPKEWHRDPMALDPYSPLPHAHAGRP